MATVKKDMEKIVALCKRRGFVFQSSDVYGGVQGFWDYGPLGVELKRNVREAWYRDMVTLHDEFTAPAGAPSAFQMVAVETSIVMHPQVWKVSGHFDLFHDFKVDCKNCKGRFRADHLRFQVIFKGNEPALAWAFMPGSDDFDWPSSGDKKLKKAAGDDADRLETRLLDNVKDLGITLHCPNPACRGELTEPREFNLMLETDLGALKNEDSKAFLRPETAQGMFVNFKNVLDSTRLKVPFGIAQIGKSFRNEITPRNFTFRSREFEQMEMEFFCAPGESRQWYEYWRDRRYKWYTDLGITSDNLILRDHEQAELAHYSVGTADVEYAFPFLDEGEYGELEGVAHRGDFDLRSHMEGKLVKDEEGNLVVEQDEHGQPKYRGSGKDLSYFDDETRERFVPHVIEPAAGADRATLAFLCEAYSEDEAPDDKGNMQTRTVLRFHPRLAPIKAAVFPLIKKEGMPEKALEVYRELKAAGINAFYDQSGAIGRRYRRQDEIGTPYCITIDGDTLADGTVTIRDRDTLDQHRVKATEVVDFVAAKLRS